MDTIKILWVDDEIDLLKPHILFLEKKNYSVTTCNNGLDAISIFEENNFDVVFLDENMPGMSGLETLSEMKEKNYRLLNQTRKSKSNPFKSKEKFRSLTSNLSKNNFRLSKRIQKNYPRDGYGKFL